METYSMLGQARRLLSLLDGWIRLGWFLFLRDFRYLAGQNILGFFWLLLKPMAAVAPFLLIGDHFELGGKQEGSYLLFALTGHLFWNLFWSAIQSPSILLRRCNKIVQNVQVPSGAVLAATFLNILLESSAMILIVGGLLLFHGSLGFSVILSVLSAPLLVLCGYSLGMWLLPMELFSRDMRYGMPYIARFLLMVAPIYYVMPEHGLLHIVNKLNPITYLIGAPRNWLVSGFDPNDAFFPVAAVFFGVIFIIGMKFNRRAMRIAAERVGNDIL